MSKENLKLCNTATERQTQMWPILGGGLAQLVTSLVASTKLINAGPG